MQMDEIVEIDEVLACRLTLVIVLEVMDEYRAREEPRSMSVGCGCLVRGWALSCLEQADGRSCHIKDTLP
jgi:hypothetical protein